MCRPRPVRLQRLRPFHNFMGTARREGRRPGGLCGNACIFLEDALTDGVISGWVWRASPLSHPSAQGNAVFKRPSSQSGCLGPNPRSATRELGPLLCSLSSPAGSGSSGPHGRSSDGSLPSFQGSENGPLVEQWPDHLRYVNRIMECNAKGF